MMNELIGQVFTVKNQKQTDIFEIGIEGMWFCQKMQFLSLWGPAPILGIVTMSTGSKLLFFDSFFQNIPFLLIHKKELMKEEKS